MFTSIVFGDEKQNRQKLVQGSSLTRKKMLFSMHSPSCHTWKQAPIVHYRALATGCKFSRSFLAIAAGWMFSRACLTGCMFSRAFRWLRISAFWLVHWVLCACCNWSDLIPLILVFTSVVSKQIVLTVDVARVHRFSIVPLRSQENSSVESEVNRPGFTEIVRLVYSLRNNPWINPLQGNNFLMDLTTSYQIINICRSQQFYVNFFFRWILWKTFVKKHYVKISMMILCCSAWAWLNNFPCPA